MRKGEVRRTRLDTAGIVDSALARLEQARGGEAEVVLPDQWPQALGYGPWVEEVWVNYISNALKYGGKPSELELGATVIAPSPDRPGAPVVRFWVADNGAGIAPEAQGRLFTPFERVSQVRATGHGLGLSIVRRIVEKLGGQVGVESAVGQGSTFWFTLPQV
ncbi:MAG: HAMP domain-containing histidine kinase [Anaerolineae bacterium]|nr:HAMP domain-containing histidine kinase [Anaerolineae bacterium]